MNTNATPAKLINITAENRPSDRMHSLNYHGCCHPASSDAKYHPVVCMADVDVEEDIQPRLDDVLLGRGPTNQQHPGNIRYSELIRQNQNGYFAGDDIVTKKLIVRRIVEDVIDNGRFLKRLRSTRSWTVVSKEEAELKVAHAIQYLQRKANQDKLRRTQAKKSQQGPLFMRAFEVRSDLHTFRLAPSHDSTILDMDIAYVLEGITSMPHKRTQPLDMLAVDDYTVGFVDWNRPTAPTTADATTDDWLLDQDENYEDYLSPIDVRRSQDSNDVKRINGSSHEGLFRCCLKNILLESRPSLLLRHTSIGSFDPCEL